MRSQSDPNSYTKFDAKGYVVLTSLYDDDLIIRWNSVKLINESKMQMSQVFDMKDLHDLH